MSKIKLATVFSGIGAIEWALKRMNIEYEIVFACDNGELDIKYDIFEEKNFVFSMDNIDEKQKYVDELYKKKTRKTNFVRRSYLENYTSCPKNRFFQDILLLDGRDFNGKVDLLVGGSPCQSFSSVGSQKGLDDPRGNLFFEFARLIKEIQPGVFIYENVRNLLKHDDGNTWKIIKETFDSLGYYVSEPAILNAVDYGIPQNRKRLFVVGYKKNTKLIWPPDKKTLLYEDMHYFLINNCGFGHFSYDSSGNICIDSIHGEVESKYFLTEKLYSYVMKSGTKTFYQNPVINNKIARPLLKTMGNRHRAGIDNYVSHDGISNEFGKVRMLTEREALRLMGFTDDFKIVVSRSQIYKQAGNSIVVDVLMSIIKTIIDCGLLEV